MAKAWTNEDDQYLRHERMLGSSVWSIASTLGRTEEDVWDRISGMVEMEKANKSLDWLVEEIFAWQQATFVDGTEEGRIAHFQEEIEEYLADPSNGEEAADAFLLFVAIFKNRGIDLRAEAERKLEINKARTWAKAPGGYSKHIYAEPEVTPDIDWEDIPPEQKYAWLVMDRNYHILIWCTSKTMPRATPQGYNGACIRIWNGDEGVRVRTGVDFRTIFRQRPEAKNG